MIPAAMNREVEKAEEGGSGGPGAMVTSPYAEFLPIEIDECMGVQDEWMGKVR
jgi:hypothetical protein